MVKNKLELDDSVVISDFRAGRRNSNSYPRTIIAGLSLQEGRTRCLRNSSQFKNTDINLNKDVGPATQAIRKAKMG